MRTRRCDLDAGVLAGQVLLRLGRLEEGETRLHRTLEKAERHGDRYRQVLALNNLGMRFVNQRRFDEALPWFVRVLSFSDLENTSVYAVSLTNAGVCYARLGDFDRAVEPSSARWRSRSGVAPPVPYEQALGELGSTYLLMDDVARGLSASDESAGGREAGRR